MQLSVTSLAAERGGRTVFTGLSFSADGGTLVRVTGANGAGKTTLLRIVAGLSAPMDGQVAWQHDGQPVPTASAACFAGHANAFNDALSVRENLSYAAALTGFSISSTVIESALNALGVRPLLNRSFGSLSQGQKKRSSLARLLLPNGQPRRAWLLDEPFVALDADTQALLATLISARLAAGGLVIYTSHQAVEISATRTQDVAL